MSFYDDEFTIVRPDFFGIKKFNVDTDKSLETELSESLNAFGIKGKVIGSESGPYITRVYFKLDLGVRFNSIEPLTDDLKMSLGTSSIKIMPDPERGAVAIEVPNAKRENIPFGNVFHANHNGMVLPAALGVDPKGKPIYLDIADTPHLLIAGTTGSGKSVCLNSIITSLALNCRPIDLQFLLIDPKGTEFVQYEGVKTLISGKIIDDVETALKSLAWLVEEMERRYKILKRCKCRSINEYKHKRDFGLNDGTSTCLVEDMPYIVVVIDEYADLMMNSAHALQEDVKRLGQKARAAGIHLILATQRPSTKIIDGDIKTNFPTRIALKVSSITDSKTILDYGGAERLLGKGDMLLKRQGQEDLQRVHGCFISDGEIKQAIKRLPKKKLFRINEENVFENDIHDLRVQKDYADNATWGELNAVSKIILENISEFLDGNSDIIYQACASQFGLGGYRVSVALNDVICAGVEPFLFRMLIELGGNYDCTYNYPFVKAVIYLSYPKWKYHDDRYTFEDYIFEQAFEKDDAAALASVRFFCNETSRLVYLKDKLKYFLEDENEKINECLVIIKNRVVDQLEKIYCDDIENYPDQELFDEFLEEAYPPLMNFLLKSGNTQHIINAAENHCEDPRVEDFIVEQALVDEHWRDFAVSYFCDDDLFAHHWAFVSDDLFVENVLKLATHDIDATIKYLCDFPDFFDLKKHFYQLTEYGQEMAINCICKQFNPSSTYSKCRQEDLILECALEGNARAISCILDNYGFFQEKLVAAFIDDRLSIENRLICHNGKNLILESVEKDIDLQHHLIDKAKQEKEYAWKIIADCIDIGVFRSFVEKILDDAQLGAENAIGVIYAHPEVDVFRGFIVSEARQNEERALKCIEANPQKEEYKAFLIEKCLEKEEWALTIICNNSDYYGSWINETIKSRCDKNDLKELLVEKILHRAKSDDNALKYVVCENPQEEKFRNLVVEKIQQNKDAFECIYQYYSRETSSNFSEFIKQRISKEFGIRYECDDNALKNAIGLLQSDYFKYFVLAVALDGNELALATVRKAFLDFSHIIVESLNSGNPQDRRYMVECVNSDTVGKLIRELAGNGNGEAIKILQMA